MEQHNPPYLKVNETESSALIVFHDNKTTIDFNTKKEGREIANGLFKAQLISREERKQLILEIEACKVLKAGSPPPFMLAMMLHMMTEILFGDEETLCAGEPVIVEQPEFRVCTLCQSKGMIYLPDGRETGYLYSKDDAYKAVQVIFLEDLISDADLDRLSAEINQSELPKKA